MKSKLNSLNKAAAFGAAFGKMAALDPTLANALLYGGVGGLALGGLGALTGALIPTETNEVVFADEEKTKPVYKPDGTPLKKKRTRGQSALREGLTGLAYGGLGGAAAGGLLTELNAQHKPLSLLAGYLKFKLRPKDITGVGALDNAANSALDRLGDEAFKVDMNKLLNRSREDVLRDAETGPYPGLANNPTTNWVRNLPFFKSSEFRNLGAVPSGAGPQQMESALRMLNQAKALVDPEKSLKAQGLPRGRFENMIDTLSKRDDKYNFSDLKKNPKTHSIVKGLAGAAAGGLAGKLTGHDLSAILALSAAGGLGGAGLGYYGASRHNNDLLSTAKVLKDYGLLQPGHLRAALPLLKA